MTEIGEEMKRLDIPGADAPPMSVLSAANEAASVGEGGLWRRVRHKWVVGLVALGLVGVPTAFALNSDGEHANQTGADLASTLLAQRREILRECLDSRPGELTVRCTTTFEDVKKCLQVAGSSEPSCAEAVPLRELTRDSSVPLKDFGATVRSERPIAPAFGARVRKARDQLREISSR